ncbi:MAG: hypothetical protein V1872_05360 [bacterium]
MKRKTTLYLEEDDIGELKKTALKTPNQNMTSLVEKAIRQFIENLAERSNSFENLQKCKGTVKENYFGNAVDLQRYLREKWNS